MANLQPLYDVKERLEHAAIAGTGLLGEDFRLSRAEESLAPLAKASPVFARISGELAGLRTAPPEERSRRLLDILSLVNAVAYTQGATGAEGPLCPLPVGGSAYRPAAYSQLHPLQEALAGTGGGRMALIQSAREAHPELFADLRVLPALIAGLGESYAELADLHFDILRSQGPAVIPRLKEGFDPAGKRDMARRAALIDALGGAAENDFYLSQLPRSRRLVRAALLYALRHHSANGPKLVALCRSERGDNRAAAHWALARSEAPEALDYWRSMEDKDALLGYMRLSSSGTATAVTAELFHEALDRLAQDPALPLTQALWERIDRLRLALEGKSGPAVCGCYRQAAALGTALDRPMEGRDKQGKSKPFAFVCVPYSDIFHGFPFSQMMPLTLNNALLLSPAPDLLALAEELFARYGGLWIVPYLTAALLTKSSQEAGALAETYRQDLCRQDGQGRTALYALLVQLNWVEKQGQYAFLHPVCDPAPTGGICPPACRPLAGPLAPVWSGLLMEAGEDRCLQYLLDPADPAMREKLGTYFYRQAVSGGKLPLSSYFDLLRACGWTKWTGLLPQWVRQSGELRYYTVMTILRELPLSDREKAAELRRLDQIAREHLVRGRTGQRLRLDWPEALVKRQLESWEGTV